MNRSIIWLLAALLIGIMAWFLLGHWSHALVGPPPEPIVEGADEVGWILGPVPEAELQKEVGRILPRPLVEYSNGALGLTLERPQTSPSAFARPLIEYSNGALAMALERPQSHYIALPRPLVEYAGSGMALVLEQIPEIGSLGQIKPRPLVEYADAGWIIGLSPPVGLLQEERGKK